MSIRATVRTPQTGLDCLWDRSVWQLPPVEARAAQKTKCHKPRHQQCQPMLLGFRPSLRQKRRPTAKFNLHVSVYATNVPRTDAFLIPAPFPLDRVEKIKEARSEAASEIEALRAAKQEEFVVYEREILGSLQTGLHQVEQETEIKLEETKRLAKLKQDEVVKLLLCAVTECDPRRHWNFQPQREEGRIGEK